MYVSGRVIYAKNCYADRNKHTTMTTPLPVCLDKLSIVGLCFYYGGGPHWNPWCYYFGCLKPQLTWLYNGVLLHILVLRFRDKHNSSTLTSGGRSK